MFNFFTKKNAEPPKLFFHTDIHCHVVPGIDDGARSAERSVALISRMKEWGINRIIATPHVTLDSFENTPEIIDKAFNVLTSALDEAGVEIDIDHSAEYRLDEFFQDQLTAGNIRPLPHNYILVENSYIQEPWNLEEVLFDLKLRGLQPILAHPERYIYYQDKRERYERLHSQGTLFQINVLSLAGYYGKEPKKIAEYLIDKGFVDFIGTDLHRSSHADSIDEYLRSRDYQRHREKLEGVVKNDEVFGLKR